MLSFKGHFDGKVVVPDEPVSISTGTQYVFRVEDHPVSPAHPITLAELASSEFAGAWADRVEITDSVAFVNDLRRQLERGEL